MPGPESKVKIYRSLIVSFYLIIPITFTLVLLDSIFFGKMIKKSIPYSPQNILIFATFFELPHIVASLITFSDPQVISKYRKELLFPVPILVFLAIFLPKIIGSALFGAFFYIVTIIHFVGQQFGLIKVMDRFDPRHFGRWKLTGILFGILLQFGLVGINLADYRDKSAWISVTILLGLAFGFSSIRIYQYAGNALGKLYAVGNFFMLGIAHFYLIIGYPLFAMMVPRVIHDITALSFDMVHDHNRNRKASSNLLYSALIPTKIPVLVLCPILAVVLAFPLTWYKYRIPYQADNWIFIFITALHFFHYYTDSFVWKQSSPHRDFVEIH